MSIVAAAFLSFMTALAPVNCASPDSPVDAVICADPSLRAAENSLRAAYNSLLFRTQESSRVALGRMWARYLKDRRTECRTVTGEDIQKLEECVRRSTDSQRQRISGTPLSGPGFDAQTVVDFVGRMDAAKTAGLEILLPRFVDPKRPGERIVNRTLANFIRRNPYVRPAIWPRDTDLIFHVYGSIAFATPDFVSVSLSMRRPSEKVFNDTVIHVNQLLDGRQPTQFYDLFVPGAAPKVTALCKSYLDDLMRNTLAEMTRSGIPVMENPEVDAQLIASRIERLENWGFTAEGVLLNALAIADTSDHFCVLKSADLKPLLVPGVEIWP